MNLLHDEFELCSCDLQMQYFSIWIYSALGSSLSGDKVYRGKHHDCNTVISNIPGQVISPEKLFPKTGHGFPAPRYSYD